MLPSSKPAELSPMQRRKMERERLENQITPFEKILNATKPTFDTSKPIYWDKEIHNYRVSIFKAIQLSYPRVWENRFISTTSIIITQKDNSLEVEFDPGFLQYFKELYPQAFEIKTLKQ